VKPTLEPVNIFRSIPSDLANPHPAVSTDLACSFSSDGRQSHPRYSSHIMYFAMSFLDLQQLTFVGLAPQLAQTESARRRVFIV
jgi:hypothetical protein